LDEEEERGHNTGQQGKQARAIKKKEMQFHLHDFVDTLHSVDMMKKRRTGYERHLQERRGEGPDAHLHDTVGTLQSVDIIVGHPNSFCQALLMTLD